LKREVTCYNVNLVMTPILKK